MLMGAPRNALRAFNAGVSLSCLCILAHRLPHLFRGLFLSLTCLAGVPSCGLATGSWRTGRPAPHRQIVSVCLILPGGFLCQGGGKLRLEDIFVVLSDGRPARIHYNVVVIQYLLSHLYNTNQEHLTLDLFQGIIDNIISNRSQDSPFLIIITDVDSCNKGRNRWYNFLDMLEDAGFCGNAYARSAFPNGDLGGERWTNYYHRQSPSFQKISYQYVQNQSDHDGAQLVIELR